MNSDTSLNLNSGVAKKDEKSTEAMGTIANASEKKPVLFTPAPETAGTIANSDSAAETAGTIASSNSGSSGSFNITA